MWMEAGIAAAVGVVGVGGYLYWRARRRKQPRLISFVALLREPFSLDPAVLARVAGRVWKADLGDGTSEGADGFVVGADPFNTILHQGHMFLVNSFPKPYVENPEESAEDIADMRLRQSFSEHQAWFSCDALGVDGTTPEEEVHEIYRRLGKLFAELLDDNCLMIFLPDTSRGYAINEDTEAALRSDDPVEALQATLTVPIIQVSEDVPRMQQAQQQAREEWPKFVAAFEARLGENFSVKAPISAEGNTEFIWLSVTAIEGDRIYGELGNDPGNLGSLRLGSKVSTPVIELNDWCYVDPQGELQGGFTIAVVRDAAHRKSKS
jgi:uncharacterized protein YegJ (DUF2314 family)